jgi:hypothetical protein
MAINKIAAMTRNLHIFLRTLKSLLGRTKWVLYRNCLIDFLEGGKNAQLSSNTVPNALHGNLSAMYLHNEIALYTFDATKDTIPTQPLPQSIPDSKFSEYVDILLSLDLVLGDDAGEPKRARKIVHAFLREDEKDMQWETFLGDDMEQTEGALDQNGAQEDKSNELQLANLLAALELGMKISHDADPSKDKDAMDLD